MPSTVAYEGIGKHVWDISEYDGTRLKFVIHTIQDILTKDKANGISNR